MDKWVIIMRGLPGSGKSTYAKTLAKELDAVIHSTDEYFIKDGVYTFDREKLGHFHKLNFEAFKKSLDSNKPAVIVDNTNVRRSDAMPYIKCAKEKGYKVKLVEFTSMDLKKHFNRCIHNVPEANLVNMQSALTGGKIDLTEVDEYTVIDSERKI